MNSDNERKATFCPSCSCIGDPDNRITCCPDSLPIPMSLYNARKSQEIWRELLKEKS